MSIAHRIPGLRRLAFSPRPAARRPRPSRAVATARSPGALPRLEEGAAPAEIRVEGLGRAFKGRAVLRGVDLTVHAGEIVAVVGASGSGKTVLLDHLTGLLRPDAGRVLVTDHNARGGAAGPAVVDLNAIDDDALDRVRLHWSVVFQHNALFTGSVRDNVALWLREHTGLSERRIDERVRASLAAAALDVADVIDKDRDALSGGMAKRVAIARAIAMDPVVVFYDEPTTGLDPIVGGHIHDLIWNTHHLPVGPGAGVGSEPRGGSGVGGERVGAPRRTTIIVTHDKDLLRRIRPRIVMIHQGSVCYDGPYDGFGRDGCEPARRYLENMPVLHAGG